MGPPMMRPSNSGIATWVAASTGSRPSLPSCQRSRDMVTVSAWITGTPSASSAEESHCICSSEPPSSGAEPPTASPALEPPVASIVVISASTWPSSSSSAATRPSPSRRSV
jgi:hypothetical protein